MTTIGILGAGQLGRMLGQAALPLGVTCRFLDPAADPPAAAVGRCITAAFDDALAQQAFAAGCQALTWEFENVSLAAVETLSALVPMRPGAQALAAKQDRLDEKRFFNDLGIATAPFAPVSSREELADAVASIGLPAVLKTRRDGYDGKGQMVLREPADLDRAWATLGAKPLILEGFIPFLRECSLLAVRGLDGEIRCWSLVENEHRHGILHRSLAPAPHAWVLQAQAETAARAVLERLDYVGVLAIEFFQHEDRLLANEFAPRVHNSGHWTIEGAVTSQFSNHIRAVAGLPLGVTAMRGHAAMINVIGAWPILADLLAIPGTQVHDYGKAPRPGRKLGHVTVVHEDASRLADLIAAIEALVVAAAPERALPRVASGQ
mgnify:CR=1 FL=1